MSQPALDAHAGTLRPRLGFAGVGWIGKHRLAALADSGVVEICAIADTSTELMDQCAAMAPQAVRSRSLAELLDLPLDGVVIATPSALHAEQAISALERGIAVFCQKPLGRTAAETAAVVAAARAADCLLGVDFAYRETEAMKRIRELIGAGELGDIYAVNLVFHNAYGPDKPWYSDKALAGGGCMMDLGIHLVDLLLWALDANHTGDANGTRVLASRLYAGSRRLPDCDASGAVEDYAAALLELPGGAVAQLTCSWRLMAGQDAVIEASFYGSRGGAAMRNQGGSFYDFCAEVYRGTTRQPLYEPPDAWGGRAAVSWARALSAGAGFDARAADFVRVAAVIDALYERAND